MSTAHTRYQIVVGLDRSEHADAVLQHAVDQAVRHERPTLHLATVVGSATEETRAGQALVELARRTLDDAVPVARREGWTVLLHVVRGNAEEEIAELAAEVHADLIVVGHFGLHHSRGAGIADRLLSLADCPVLVVGPPRDTTATDRQCPDCVEVRERTSGENWFCARHHGEWSGHLVLHGGPADRGGALL